MEALRLALFPTTASDRYWVVSPEAATGNFWPMSVRRVASASGQKPNDPKASTEGGIHEPMGAGFESARAGRFRAFRVAGLRVESVAGLIGIRSMSYGKFSHNNSRS